MSHTLVNALYLLASVLFIIGIKGLTHPRTAVRGNLVSAAGMLIAIVATMGDTEFSWPIVIAGLIVVGGLGFPVLSNLARTAWHRARGRRMVDGSLVRITLHTKLVLITSLVVYLVGVGVIGAERVWLAGRPVGPALLDAHFMSVVARTAGFETVAPAELGPPSRFALIFYAATMIATSLILTILWEYSRRRGLMDKDVADREHFSTRARSALIPGVMLLSIGLSFFSLTAARTSWSLILIGEIVLRRSATGSS